MGIHALMLAGIASAWLQGAAPEKVVLHNELLTVTFEPSDTGPHLTELQPRQTGTTYHLAETQAFSLFVLPAAAIHDPTIPVTFASPTEFVPSGIDVASDKTSARVRYEHPLVQVEVRYQLESHAAVLRKTIVCKAKDKPVYVAGVRQWILKPTDSALIWPKSGTLGQPAVLLAENAGYLLTLEFPMSEVLSEQGEIIVGDRPGYELAPGQSQEVAAGSVVCFTRTFQKSPLDAAREAFFEHMVARVKPKALCPIKFTTWGPWLAQARADRILEIMDDLAYIGTDLLHFDAGWQWADRPYSQRLPTLRDVDAAAWDRGITQPERLPNGLLPLVKAAKQKGMAFSLWFDTAGHTYITETEDWAVRDEKGEPIHGRVGAGANRRTSLVQSLTSEYGDRFRAFVLEALKRYTLSGVMFDDNTYIPDHSREHHGLASGWDTPDISARKIMELADECDRRHPGVFRFFCRNVSWPWALLHFDHIHAGDPGAAGAMLVATATDYPARALAYERRLAWKRHYDNFVPPWGIKGDIAGWAVQQGSAIPVNLAHTDQIISSGEGWTQNMFTCFATTRIRDIRFSFRQMPRFDRDVLKEWLAWDRQHVQFIFNCRPLFDFSENPNSGVVGFSHVGEGRGVIYLFNTSFESAEAKVVLDENAGFRKSDMKLPAQIVYPMKARASGDTLSYGETLKAPIAGKDCLVIEVGLEVPPALAPYADYEKAVASIRRSFDTLFWTPPESIVAAAQHGPIRLEVGKGTPDRRLAAEILETLGAVVGRRMSVDECEKSDLAAAGCRLIVGTHEGLSGHPEVGKRFRETLYNRYIEWDGKLVSAPLAVALPGGKQPTFCLIAPRPEQLARLAIDLTSAINHNAKPTGTEHPDPSLETRSITAAVPAGRPVLRFRPLMKITGRVVMPNELNLVRYEIHAEHGGERTLIWREDIPPFCTFHDMGGWWDDRIISLADLAGQKVTLHFTAGPIDGRQKEPRPQTGFEHVAVLELGATQ